ncbi:MAG: acyloxyacyl hydrolase [Proteobacteria bacterium]|nr:acyloxyacyl hydrolase [Pseudomonadota bacterium]
MAVIAKSNSSQGYRSGAPPRFRARCALTSPGLGAGILLDVYFGRRFVVTPSFAPTYWRGKTNDLDLGHEFEFRSQIEFAYRFDNRARLGVAISHSSNASIVDTNPGTETILVNYSIPLGKHFSR